MVFRKFLYYRSFTCRSFRGVRRSVTTNVDSVNQNRREEILISTPIFYVNSAPHIGHLYTTVLADAITRWHKLHGNDVLFSTGTDEHGLKIQHAAAKRGTDPLQFCNYISGKFKHLFERAGVEYSDYIRTTESRHLKAVHHVWNVLQDAGHIYKGSYEGWYCTSDETFLKSADITETTNTQGDPVKVSKESGHIVEWVKEENYMFRLSSFQNQLLDWLDKKVIVPSHPYESLVRDMVSGGLEDLSVSRQSDRLTWGISVPGDPTQTIYVWLDALTNYLTVCGYPDNRQHIQRQMYHLVGKDILKFHAVYWPAFLMACGETPPTAIYCHAHWLMDYKKMSKSIGNVVDPLLCLDKYSSDAVRYFLLREGVPHSDGNFSEGRLVDCVNSELVNTLGNLLSRCTGDKLNVRQVIPQFHQSVWEKYSDSDDRRMWEDLDTLPDRVDQHFQHFEIYQAINTIMSQLRDTNAFLQKHKPWELVKNVQDTEWLDTILHISLETLRLCGILLQPIVPGISDHLLSRLNVSDYQRGWKFAVKNSEKTGSRTLGRKSSVLMKRIK